MGGEGGAKRHPRGRYSSWRAGEGLRFGWDVGAEIGARTIVVGHRWVTASMDRGGDGSRRRMGRRAHQKRVAPRSCFALQALCVIVALNIPCMGISAHTGTAPGRTDAGGGRRRRRGDPATTVRAKLAVESAHGLDVFRPGRWASRVGEAARACVLAVGLGLRRAGGAENVAGAAISNARRGREVRNGAR